MADVVGVVFRGGGKVYHFDPAGLELSRGDRVVVQTSSGPEIGQVVEPSHEVDDSEIPAQLKKVARVATDKDLESRAASEDLRTEAMARCRELIASHGLDMKLVDADIGFGGEKITFSFFSEERVDFRALVADLAKILKMRIELRQVGAREEARMVGGLGPCGRALCCTLFPGDDDPVSIRMAKEQNLPLNPVKISGLCGRLMCCLKYEQEQYVRFRKEAPAKGTPVATPVGDGTVSGYNVTKEAISIRLEDGSFTEVKLCSCEHQEDGSLICTPEEQTPAGWLDGPVGLGTVAPEQAPEPSLEGEAATEGEGAEVPDTAGSERPRRGRGRRGRGRRRGGGQGQTKPAGETAAGAAEAGGAAAEGDEGRGGKSRGHRSGKHGGQRSDQRRQDGGGDASGAGGEQASGGTSGAGSGSSRSKRRRRSRRPSGASGGGGNGTASSGSSGSGSGGTGGGGNSDH